MPRINDQRLVTFSIMLATVMQALDTTIANVALPHMQGSLSASTDQATWVLTSYIVSAAIMTPAVGFMAGRIGRRRLFLWSVAGFTLASGLCGLATSLEEMVLFRILQGVFGAALVPLSQSVLLDTYPVEQHGQAMAIWGMGVMVGPILGPTLGGWLTEWYSWRWVFYINLPFGLMAFAGIWLSVTETETRKVRFDMLGFALLALAIGAFQLMLDRGEQEKWFGSFEIQIEALLAALGFYLFVAHSLTKKNPFIDLALFKDRNFVTGVVFIFVVGIILLATMALLPPFLQQWKGYPAVTTGLVLAPRGLGSMFSMMLVGRLMRTRLDARILVVVGLSLVTLSLHQMAGFTLEVSTEDLIWTGILQGAGLGLVFVPASTLTYATLDPALRTEGTSLFSLSRNLGSSVGISIMTAMLSRNLWINNQQLGERINLSGWIAQGLPMKEMVGSVPAAVYQTLQAQAAEISYMNDFRLLMWINMAAIPLVFLLRNNRQPPTPKQEASAEVVGEP
ncbi:DHA2 family efflux MFS transporter permease subunit [Alloalcanivorax mobilis]|uniref:DHA2 family efflux MFS transporter permease subunit n=1 Tax=Alloalcanivorax mobilis TaxID=2019569 RepID=UPI000B5B4510|nr:DHA2 family efflux MFS transporter permease subunit [Alloalcanivorax mobilis]ASK35199.1 EmrB/QacA family drug resistance transporter [Alcanivorax sp. N3-2A]|tara:strand:- start:39350 stop:40873 length:1524 start_codon:yes stop_codon:yes gene_type:complete